jgi:uroporphyrinogen-III decarboxylase
MSNRIQALKDLAGAVGRNRLVEGWIEGPCAEAADLRGINRLMLDFYDDPDFVHELMDFVVEVEMCEIIDIDAAVLMAAARQAVGVEQVLCGNLDPVRSIHEGTPDEIPAEFGACHADGGSRYIVGGGCEIPRGTSLDNFLAIVDFARLTSGS